MKKYSIPKKYAILIIALVLLFLSFESSALQNGYDLFQKALAKERAEGNLEEAIALYKKVIAETKDESLAAKAQLRIGICYEKLGIKKAKQAQIAFQKVVDNYPMQTETVKVAKDKLTVLLRAQAVVKKGDKEFKISPVLTVSEWLGFSAASIDGKYLSGVDWETGDLATYEIATGKTRRLTNKGSWQESYECASSSVISPDSKLVAYAWEDQNSNVDLRLIGIDGSEPRILYRNEEVWIETADWSPDGKYILARIFREDQMYQTQLGLVSVANGSVRILKTLKALDPSLIGALFSTDGRYVAYHFPPKEDTQEHDIFLLSIDGSQEVPLAPHPAHDYLLGWAPDGKKILFASNRSGTMDAWIIQVAEGKPQGEPILVRRNIGAIEPIGFTPEGSFYYHTPGGLLTDIYSATLDPVSGKVITPPKKEALPYEGQNRYPALSPDGKYLAYISSRGAMKRRRILCIYSVETGKVRELWLKGWVAFPRWSPDGHSILVKDGYGPGGDIYRINAQTGDVTPFIQQKDNEYIHSPIVSPDGKSVIYARENHTTKLYRIQVRDIETGEEKELDRAPFDNPAIALSPDGQQLALLMRVDKNVRVLKVMPSTGGEQKELYRFEQRGRWIIDIAWAPDGRYIYFSKGPDPGQFRKWELWRAPSEGGKAQNLGLKMPRFRHLCVHPHGRRVTFSSTSKSELPGTWVMENFLPKEKN